MSQKNDREIIFDTNDEEDWDSSHNEDHDIDRFWERMYRICTKELINQGLQFDSLRSRSLLTQMINNQKSNPQIQQQLVKQQQKNDEQTQKNKDFLSICFQRYMLAYSIFKEVSEPDFYEKHEEDDDDDDDY